MNTKLSDPVMIEVLKNALESIADGMALTVVRTARSFIVKISMDFSTAILTPEGEIAGQGMCIPIHLGGMTPALRAVLDRYAGKIHPGDIYINNDPYEGASHLPDIFLFKPVFADGVLMAWVCAMTHNIDIGGRVAGGNACDSTEIYQEGLRIPPLKLYDRGEPNETIFRLLEKAVRVPDKVLGDVNAQIAAIHFGERELLKVVERYGVETLKERMEELLDYSERRTRAAIAALPDGAWEGEDWIDDDGIDPTPIRIKVTLTKKGTDLFFDFTGTSPQCKGAIQPVFQTVAGVVYATCKAAALGADIPSTGGYFRPIHVSAPPGTFVNPQPPAPVAARALGCRRVAQAVLRAFANMLPGRIPACYAATDFGMSVSGYDRSKLPWKPFVHLEFHTETARGGSAGLDGADAQAALLTNLSNVPAEMLEMEQPLRIEQYGLVPDTGGAGEYRGGLAMVREWRMLAEETLVQMRSDRMKFHPWGLFGGQEGSPTIITVNPDTPNARNMPSKFLVTLKRGDLLRMQFCSAGGYGDPRRRDPQLVLADVREGKISSAYARETYGVVVDIQRMAVDYAATKKLREELDKRDTRRGRKSPGNPDE